MANSYFEVDVGVNVGGVSINATSGNITTTGNIILNTTTISYTANSVTPKSYVDNIAVVFGV
jgi:hypothetical protein